MPRTLPKTTQLCVVLVGVAFDGSRMTTVARQFAKRLRAERDRAGLSQEALAHKSDLHPNAIGLIERGEREPMLSTVLALAGALGITPGELLDGLSRAAGPDSG